MATAKKMGDRGVVESGAMKTTADPKSCRVVGKFRL
jgi:hypothetical protein